MLCCDCNGGISVSGVSKPRGGTAELSPGATSAGATSLRSVWWKPSLSPVCSRGPTQPLIEHTGRSPSMSRAQRLNHGMGSGLLWRGEGWCLRVGVLALGAARPACDLPGHCRSHANSLPVLLRGPWGVLQGQPSPGHFLLTWRPPQPLPFAGSVSPRTLSP